MNPWFLVGLIATGSADPSGAATMQAARATIDGHVAATAIAFPKRDAVELRPEAWVEITSARGPVGLRAGLEVIAQALVADRDGHVNDLRLDVRDAWIEVAGAKADVRAGFGRVIWGRLDEVQPSDVINPVDAARFLIDGRAAARLAVPFVRGRFFASDDLSVESVIVPAFRRGTFDELDESSSPFNLINDALPPALAGRLAVRHETPAFAVRNLSGGARVSATVGRVDVAAAVYRGFEPFGVIGLEPAPASPIGVALVERHERFTMIAGDFETVAGEWALRGEVAAFTETSFAAVPPAGLVPGRAVDGGIGVERRAGDFRVFGTVLVRREWSPADPRIASTNTSLVGSIERTFDRERCKVRAFAVVNPGDASGFVRGLFTWNVRDNTAVEFSAAGFMGSGDDRISRFRGRDFLFGRVRWFF